MTSRQIEQVNHLRTELEGLCRMTPRLAVEHTQDPREAAGRSQSALTIFERWDALVESLRDDPEATRWLELLRFDREKITAGVRAILDIALSKAERETRLAVVANLAEARRFCQITLEAAQRLDTLRAAADKAAGPFPGVKIKLSPELRKALTILAEGRL